MLVERAEQQPEGVRREADVGVHEEHGPAVRVVPERVPRGRLSGRRVRSATTSASRTGFELGAGRRRIEVDLASA